MIIIMKRKGFSVVELIIVITVMAILITTSMLNMSGVQANARDTERMEDAETIALHLETYYNSGKDGDTAPPASYPSLASLTDPVTGLFGSDKVHQYLRDVDDSSVTTPDKTEISSTFVAATNNSAQTPTIDQYVYQPLQSDNSLCTLETQECVKYVIYYRLEKDNQIYTVKSKNQ